MDLCLTNHTQTGVPSLRNMHFYIKIGSRYDGKMSKNEAATKLSSLLSTRNKSLRSYETQD